MATEDRIVIALHPQPATRHRMLSLHRRGLITLGLVEDDPAPKGDRNAVRCVVVTSGIRDEHKLISVLVGAETAQPGTHPMAETFHVVAHAEARDPWYLYGLDHTRIEPALAAYPQLQGRNWSDLTAEERAAVESLNKARFERGEVGPDDMFCLEFGPDSPADLAEFVVFSMPASTIHGELRRPSITGRAARFYVDELDLKAPPAGYRRPSGPCWFTVAGPAIG